MDKYELEHLCICFNGGKDCTALLHLVHAVMQKRNPGKKVQLHNLYVQGEHTFPEMEAFVTDTTKRQVNEIAIALFVIPRVVDFDFRFPLFQAYFESSIEFINL